MLDDTLINRLSRYELPRFRARAAEAGDLKLQPLAAS
jgi:hypothetical protein